MENKEIKEMARDFVISEQDATYMYDVLGYRKIPKDSVVLSREEYQKDFSSQFNKGYKYGSKETAEKILQILIPPCEVCDENWHSGCLCLRATIAEKIAKQFGIDIKE